MLYLCANCGRDFTEPEVEKGKIKTCPYCGSENFSVSYDDYICRYCETVFAGGQGINVCPICGSSDIGIYEDCTAYDYEDCDLLD